MNNKKSNYTQKKKNNNMLCCFGVFLLCSLIAFLCCPWFISVIGLIAFVLGVISYKKKSVEEKALIEHLKNCSNEQISEGKNEN